MVIVLAGCGDTVVTSECEGGSCNQAGSGGQVGSGGGGSGGSGGIGGGGAGGSGAGGNVGCSSAQPKKGEPCDTTEVCAYTDTPPGLSCEVEYEASCVDGTWEFEKPATCGPPDGTCDPVGDFLFDYEDPTFSMYNPPDDLAIYADMEGVLYAESGEAGISSDGCVGRFEWRLEVCTPIGGMDERCILHDYEADVDFSLSPPAGTMVYTEQFIGQSTPQSSAFTLIER